MAHVFISYAREDLKRIELLVTALESRGWSVFWDRKIPAGETWRSYIGQALADAGCVIVAWSRHSITSKWVLREAADADQRDVLVPVLLESVEPPFGFREIQAADLVEWNGDPDTPSLQALAADLTRVLGAPPARETAKTICKEGETSTWDNEPGPAGTQTLSPAGTTVTAWLPKVVHWRLIGALVVLCMLTTYVGVAFVVGWWPFGGPQGETSQFVIPAVTYGGPDGVEDYIDPVIYDSSNTADLAPGQASPEAAVVHVYASLIRGDTRFREVIAPSSILPPDISEDLRNYSFMETITWDVKRVKLHSRRQYQPGRMWITLWMEVSYQGELDEGTDEVELILVEGKWYVVRLPT
jgi:hypothetical protein